MITSQPVISTRRRTRKSDRSLSRFVDHSSENRVATRSTTKRLAEAQANELSQTNEADELNPISHSQALEEDVPTVGDDARNDLTALDSVTSALENSSLSNENQNDMPILSSQHIGSTPLAGPTTAEVLAARRCHKITTYKQRRSLRPNPAEGEDRLSLRSRQVTRSISTPNSTPSCSPAPTYAASKSRNRRRRQVPLKHRLARAARSRLPPNISQDTHSQPPIAVLSEPTEEDAPVTTSENASLFAPEEEAPAVLESNIAQRHLTAPQNHTIPDLKDLLSAKHQPFPDIGEDGSSVGPQRNSLPQFILPPNNTLHSPKPRVDPKRGRPGRRDLPRLSFVPLEAHQKQTTSRPIDKRASQAVQVRRVPLLNQIPAPSARSDIHTFNTPPRELPVARVNFLTPGQNRSPSRVFVKGTPEPAEQLLHLYPDIADGPSFLRASKPSPRPTDLSSDTSWPVSEPGDPPVRLYAPMSNLLDDLTKLAKSAARMDAKSPAPRSDRSTQKRTYQAALTRDGYLSHIAPETGSPTKTRRLE
ncbi:hypothetical protein RhiJN_03002 [Ceratobasidium sp. AG-Ba]|nr:hypothetical protein RhiJN_03002 [Ceratobasidium sp. AG-Ba]QRW03890.1 hypothetical protein RhiLY_02889 [Ceratobasidium sp. AG-Ba]